MTPRPTRVEGSEEGLAISWNDGHESVYPNRFLRLACQCAECVDEWTREPRIHQENVPQDVHIEEGGIVGQYALRFHWSDGHDTGIYSFNFLRDMCQCPDCREQAISANRPPRRV
ncbi:MAG: DUF971 domain-containing protein [Chloroflexi bacterium]|nr:DUF971 domain-containing protein [Chloroflexota bacterium]